MKNKVLIPVIISVIVLIIIIIIIAIPKDKKTEDPKKELTGYVEELATYFYEDFYWSAITKNEDSKEEKLGKFSEIGIKIDLDNLSRYSNEKTEELMKKLVNPKTKQECDKKNTMVTIYPEKPYGKKNYKMEITLECGFEE